MSTSRHFSRTSTSRQPSYTFARHVPPRSPAIMPQPAPKVPAKAFILQLPNECLMPIVELLDQDNPKDVKSLRRTCRRMHEVCEPVLCRFISNDNFHWRSQELMLQARPERHDYVKTFAVYTPHIDQAGGITKMLWPMTKFRRLEELHVSEDWFQPGRNFGHADTLFAMLNGVLTHCAFPNLRECTLFAMQRRPIMIAPILKAPKLTTLRVSFPIFDYTDDSLPPPNSTALKHLTLMIDPRMDRNMVLGIIGMAKALETLEFDDSRTDLTSLHHEGILQSILPDIAESQSTLSTLKVFLAQKSLMSDRDTTGDFDFTGLTNLKTLSFTNHYPAPFNCFVKLPADLNTLRLNSFVNLRLLAQNLDFVLGRTDFSCPPHVEISQDLHLLHLGRVQEPPLTQWAQRAVDEKVRDFVTLVHRLPCGTLTWKERDGRFERMLEATRVLSGGNLTTHDGRLYELRHGFRVRNEKELVDGEYLEASGSDLCVWGQYIHHRPWYADTELA